MMNILDKIIESKKDEVRVSKELVPVYKLEGSVFFKRKMPSFYKALAKPEPSIIGEFKRKSPSKGIINNSSDVVQVAKGYKDAGISAISVLTDHEFFGGQKTDLEMVAESIQIPLLRKDFIIDEYQVIESKSIGASAILLIASVLNKIEIKQLAALAHNLGLDILFEIHDEEDVEKIVPAINIVGINNRNLNNFEIDMDNSRKMIDYLPQNCIKVAESGLRSHNDVNQLFKAGFDAFLIGENFMRSNDPGLTASQFIKDLKSGLL